MHVHADESALPDDTDRLEHLARYITRAPIWVGAVTPLDAARVGVCTPPVPQTGSQSLELDELEMIRLICAQARAPPHHFVRYHGWTSHRARGVRGGEVDPLLCPRRNAEMRLVSVIQTPAAIDGILDHMQWIGGNSPHERTAQHGLPLGCVREMGLGWDSGWRRCSTGRRALARGDGGGVNYSSTLVRIHSASHGGSE